MPIRSLRRRGCSKSVFVTHIVLVSACIMVFGTHGLTPRVSTARTVQGVMVTQNPLHRGNHESPFCYVASSSLELPPGSNFLATQLWPSARVASHMILQHARRGFRSMCELGCGPGLPSLTFAKVLREVRKGMDEGGGRPSETWEGSVVATDVDTFALQLVRHAAQDQGLAGDSHHGSDILVTKPFDLIEDDSSTVPTADLYVMADVFESSRVARGAARLTADILRRRGAAASVWVFAQSDRVQRDAYLQQLRVLLPGGRQLEWQPAAAGPTSNLWLCNVEETAVKYE